MALSLTILTGQSGSGKSTAINTLEDQGYYCVDNMPARLVENLCDLIDREEISERLALIVDVRERTFVEEVPDLIARLREQYTDFRVIYFESKEDILLRRYSETRRIHPLDDGCGLRSAIEREINLPSRSLKNTSNNLI